MKVKHYAMFAGGVILSIVAVRIILSILPASLTNALPAVARV